ncbi:kinase-like domain-containing protein [Pavlovales sp. CCMP2436]|nr:kinase-like domain-containing protein [Pavlovales sp. CCMP2436]
MVDTATADGIPSIIGPKTNQYQLDRTQLLGDGHSGQVYAGWKVSNKAMQVAIKLDKTAGAKHEWAMLKKMEGKGVPKVHYTGVSGKWHVCVMDRLGPTLATWADSMRYTHPHSHLREQVSSVGRKLLRLLQGLHETGDIHGDVKPENFLVPYKQLGETQAPLTNVDMLKNDPVMVDLGFSSSWRKTVRCVRF